MRCRTLGKVFMVSLLAVLLLNVNTVMGASIIKGPYLQKVTQSSIVVMWETDTGADSRVDYGSGSFVYDESPVKIHEIEISDLSAGETYIYSVTSGTAKSPDSTFTTAPNDGSGFRFAAYGDTRTYPDDHRAVIQAMIPHDPEIVIHVGDLVQDGRIYEEWEPQFFTPAKDLMVSKTMFPVLGNHEYNGSGQIWFFNFFSLPNNEEYFAFNYGCARFVALNTCVDFKPGSNQYNWLVSELNSSEYQQATWHFFYLHHPPYSSGTHATEQATLDLQTYIVPLFEDHGADIVFCGHDHIYERSYKDGVNYVLTGGGGAPLRGVNLNPNPYQVYAESVFEHCIIDVTPEGYSLVAYGNDGSVLDSFEYFSDTIPPVISGVEAVDITDTTARMVWTTDEQANSFVEYGIGVLNQQRFNGSYVLSHSIELTDLLPDTTYIYQVTSTDSSGNYSTEGGFTFTTMPVNLNAYVTALNVSYGTVNGEVDATNAEDGFVQAITESPNGKAGMASLDAEYRLFTEANPLEVTRLDLYLVSTWTGASDNDPLNVYIQKAGTWEDITDDIIADGVFSPGSDFIDYMDSYGNIRVRFTDSSAMKKEKKDTLEVDLLYAAILVGPPINYPPVAQDQSVVTQVSTPIEITLKANDSNNDPLSFSVKTQPQNGGLSGDPPDLTYTPGDGFTGSDSFTFMANDGEFDSNLGMVTIQVRLNGSSIHVEDIQMSLHLDGKKYQATAMITVGPGIDGALVLGDWYFKGILIGSGASGITGTDGTTSIISMKKPAKSGDTFVFTVTDILLDGYTYKPDENIVTQGEIPVP